MSGNEYTEFELYEIYKRFTNRSKDERQQAMSDFMAIPKHQAKAITERFDARYTAETGEKLIGAAYKRNPIIFRVVKDGVNRVIIGANETANHIGVSAYMIWSRTRNENGRKISAVINNYTITPIGRASDWKVETHKGETYSNKGGNK